jgi:cation diffusion facilitator CzcD-associated flavoprotein CzcO
MKVVDKKQKNWRVVKKPTRITTTMVAFLKGLQTSVDPELIDVACVSDVDGFIIHSNLWRKDWSLVNSNVEVIDNITIVTVANTVECTA